MAAEEGELELSCKVLGNAPLTTRERIRRDRELHRLGLNLVERVPKDVLVDLVQVSTAAHSPDQWASPWRSLGSPAGWLSNLFLMWQIFASRPQFTLADTDSLTHLHTPTHHTLPE